MKESIDISLSDFSIMTSFTLPIMDDDGSSSTVIFVYFISDQDKGYGLKALSNQDPFTFNKLMMDVFSLEEEPEYTVIPGGTYHRYAFEIVSPDLLLISSTTALDV